MPTYNFRVDAAAINKGMPKVAFTEGFGNLPVAASGQAWEWSNIAAVKAIAAAAQDNLPNTARDLIALAAGNISAISDLAGYTVSAVVANGSITITVAKA